MIVSVIARFVSALSAVTTSASLPLEKAIQKWEQHPGHFRFGLISDRTPSVNYVPVWAAGEKTPAPDPRVRPTQRSSSDCNKCSDRHKRKHEAMLPSWNLGLYSSDQGISCGGAGLPPLVKPIL